MRRHCANPSCSLHLLNRKNLLSQDPDPGTIRRNGYYYRRSDQRKISRYHCTHCGTYFSSATFDENYHQKRRDLNLIIEQILCSNVSQRRCAQLLQVNQKTVVKKFLLLAHRAVVWQQHWLQKFHTQPATEVQFDDLETSEHTKCKPISVTLAVVKKSGEILYFVPSRMPAKGLLAKTARKKYGPRKDERPLGWDQFFQHLTSLVDPCAQFHSDENPHYPKALRKYFPQAKHLRTLGGRGSIAGQGELKKKRFDPLFSLNHTCAMLRANLNRLIRRTWCTTKTLKGLTDHLNLYVAYHNRVLIPAACAIKGGS